jgi:hypothetical protein
MSRRSRLELRYIATITVFAFQWIFVANSARAACYDTPRAAIDALVANTAAPLTSKSGGYKVIVTQSDPVLGKRWAMVASCDHPERPAFALPCDGVQLNGHLSMQNIPEAVVVHAGDTVRLWRQDALLRIETAGVSEESGAIGKTIRLRLLHGNLEDQSSSAQLVGIVRGPLDVEIQQ